MAKKTTKRSDADRRVRQSERLARLMKTLYLISGKGRWDADALAEELECSRRTVYRLLETLSMAGVPWYFDEKIRAYRIRPGYKFPLIDKASRSSADTRQADRSEEMRALARQVLHDGETFAASLDKFLSAMRGVTRS